MKKLIKNLFLGTIIITSISGQPVLAADYDFNTSVFNHLENWDTEFKVDYYELDVLDVIKEIAKNDDYLNRSLSQLVYERRGDNATIKVTYKTTKEQEQYINKELSKIISEIITDDMSEYEKVSAINRYLIDRFKYDDSLVSNNAYSALTTGKTTCQGYAMAAYRMFKLAGVENRIIIGTLDNIGHGWNLVKINDKWYHIDVTNNDAASSDIYFLKDDKTMRNEGFTWIASDYPICSEKYNDKNKNYVQVSSVGYKSNEDGTWYQRGSTWYFLRNNGVYSTGLNAIDNKWYYMEKDGSMQTGWIYYSGKWYYFYPGTGSMAKDTIIDGYKIDSNGVWIN